MSLKKFLLSCYKYAFVYNLILLVLQLVTALSVPILIFVQTKLIDTASNYFEGNILYILLPILIVYFIINYLDTANIQIGNLIKLKILHILDRNITSKYLKNICSVTFDAFDNENTHNKMMMINTQLPQILNFLITLIPNTIKATIILVSIFCFILNSGIWWAFPLSILFSIPSFYFNKQRVILLRKSRKRNSHEIRHADYLSSVLLNKEASKERRLFGFISYFIEIWQIEFQKYYKQSIWIFIKTTLTIGIAMCFSMLPIIIIGTALLFPLKSGGISIGFYTSLIMAVAFRLNACIYEIVTEYSNFLKIKHFFTDYNYIHNLKKVNILQKYTQKKIIFENLTFKDVFFKYPFSENMILKGVTFEINKGEHHALVGINGAGKTTITKLMLGLYKPTKGSINLNGIEINNFDYQSIQQIFSMIMQNPGLYKSTLMENLTLYSINNDQQEMKKLDLLLQKTHSFEIKNKLKFGYQTNLTTELKDGINLSGGEWQKIQLVRLLYSNRDFIILDEPAASLDPLAEVKFYNEYHEVMKDKTALFITHRLGSTHLFNNCMVLSDGVIIEKGSYDSLLLKNGIFKNLFEKQKDLYIELD